MKRFVPIVGCMAALLISLWMLRETNAAVSADEGYEADISMNELSSQYAATQYPPNLSVDAFVPMSADDLCDYYGTNIFPSSIPAGLHLSNDNLMRLGVYIYEEPQIFWDQNVITYGEDEKRYLHVTVAKQYLWTGYYFAIGGLEGETSTVSGHEVLMGHYVDETGADEYYAKFVCRDVQFLVVSRNVSETEFVKTVASLF
jgi:hypothetical protein